MLSSIEAKPNTTDSTAHGPIHRPSDAAITADTALSKDRDGVASSGDVPHSGDKDQQKLIDTQWEHCWSL